MIQHLEPRGDGFAIPIPARLLAAIGATPETAFELRIENGAIVLLPLDDEDEGDADRAAEAEFEAAFDQAVERLHRTFGRALRKLAE